MAFGKAGETDLGLAGGRQRSQKRRRLAAVLLEWLAAELALPAKENHTGWQRDEATSPVDQARSKLRRSPFRSRARLTATRAQRAPECICSATQSWHWPSHLNQPLAHTLPTTKRIHMPPIDVKEPEKMVRTEFMRQLN
jgi:hypothetical protein